MNAKIPLSTPQRNAIYEALRLIVEPGSVTEVRVLNTPRQGTVRGYFDDLEKMARAAAGWSGNAPGVYFTLNPVTPALLARAANRMAPVGRDGKATGDSDIVRRRWFLIDIDPVRPSGISATDAEHQLALDRAQEVRAWLRARGWPDPLFADSGNGSHLLYPIDLPNDAETRTLLQHCLEALAFCFSDAGAAVDVTTFNASRICKVYGTLAAKGDNIVERPHRRANLLEVPGPLGTVLPALLQRLSEMGPQPASGNGSSKGHEHAFDVGGWLANHGLRVVSSGSWMDGKKYVLDLCPWNPAHTNRSACIVQFSNGAVAAGCRHNGCAEKDWRALRDTVEPGWRVRSAGASLSGESSPLKIPPLQGEAQGPRRFASVSEVPGLDQIPDVRIEYAVDGLIPRSCVTVISGAPASLKSYLALDLSRRVAAGQCIAGRAATQSRGLYLDRENPAAVIRERVTQFGIEPLADLHYWGLWCEDPPPALGDPRILEFARSGANPFVVYDSLIRFSSADENDATEMARVMAEFRQLAAAGATVLVLHHRSDKSGYAYRGSSEILGGCDVMWELKKREDNVTVDLTAIKDRCSREGRFSLRLELGGFVAADTVAHTQTKTALDIVTDLVQENPGIGKTDAIDRAMKKGLTKRQAQRALDRGPFFRVKGKGRATQLYVVTESEVGGVAVEI